MADILLFCAMVYFVYCEAVILFVGLTGKLKKDALLLRTFL